MFNLVCEDILIGENCNIYNEQDSYDNTTCKYSSASTWLTSRWQYCALTLTAVKQEEAALE